MSLLMTSWSSRLDRRDDEDVSQRVGSCLADAGPSITVTSLSISVALSAAYTSSFPSVANFGLYAGEWDHQHVDGPSVPLRCSFTSELRNNNKKTT